MRKKIILLGLGISLFAAACSGKGAKEDYSGQNTVQNDSDSKEKEKKAPAQDDKTGQKEDKDSKPEKQEPKAEQPGQELSKAPEVTFTDYSQNIQDEDSGVLLLAVTENCPVISIPENEAAAEKMNMVFEQQHTANQTYIQEDVKAAKDAYGQLSGEETANWNGYGYGSSYKVVYASTRILSIEAENYKWQGSAHPNTWTTSYCFDATTGALLYLYDIFTDKAEAEKIVEKQILDTITKEPYKDALMDDYESYVPDVLTENVFYLNDKGLVIICNPDMVTSYAAGTIEVEVPYKDLKSVMNPNYYFGE